jgi:hypothetical protein
MTAFLDIWQIEDCWAKNKSAAPVVGDADLARVL